MNTDEKFWMRVGIAIAVVAFFPLSLFVCLIYFMLKDDK